MSRFDELKNRDPFAFIKADDVFNYFDNSVLDTGIKQPSTVGFHEEDQQENVFTHGKIFRLLGTNMDPSFLLIEFIRPQVWRLRLNPSSKSPEEFRDRNSCAILFPSTAQLISTLDKFEGVKWEVELQEVPSYYILQSVRILETRGRVGQVGQVLRVPEIQLWIQKHPFQITAIRLLNNSQIINRFPQQTTIEAGAQETLSLHPNPGLGRAVIWKTARMPLKYTLRTNTTILSVRTPPAAQYMGFGEQGGRNLFKENTFMNYFNFDNMRYQNVYGQGPLDDREPLYHSEPYWLEIGAHFGFQNVLAHLVDNYSQTCLDVRKTHKSTIRIATRFNEFNCMIVAGNRISDLIQSFTNIIGKPSLRPRYALGYHQGCYGYDTREMVIESAKKYVEEDFPIDGMHIDVDMQNNYQTFTIDTRRGRFNDPAGMFNELRAMGVKCSTNITPHISCGQDGEYGTLNELVEKDFFVADRRDVVQGVRHPVHERYHNWEGGNRYLMKPAHDRPPYNPPDLDDLSDTYNTGLPFKGGVYYGGQNGTPAFYPNLNNAAVRQWWGEQYKYLLECGLEFVWQDMTSPCIAPQYGDMKSFPFRLLIDDDVLPGETPRQRTAIELWSLYSFNLHKATYEGLKNIPFNHSSLEWRKGRRNFIIGRGSYTGAHRYAGLWTGDNSSTWDFFSISVVQVLALGLSGNAITGQDVGGFEYAEEGDKWAEPELLIRWYGAYSLLPWFRNHYTKFRTYIDDPHTVRKTGKLFQEPWAFKEYYDLNQDGEDFRDPRDALLFRSVLPVCKYYVRLRYSLMQVLYDAMFENAITGLPIARSMLITDDQDISLLYVNKKYANDQYLLRNDILVAPPMSREDLSKPHEVYLPYPDEWFPMNLRPDEPLGKAIDQAISGGSHVFANCLISDNEEQLPYITPMYIREGAIIPKIQVQQSTQSWYSNGYPIHQNKKSTSDGESDDKAKNAETDEIVIVDSLAVKEPAPVEINIHVYPGKDNVYTMYLDDGTSTNSEPVTKIPHLNPLTAEQINAANKYCEVRISQTSYFSAAGNYIRNVKIKSVWDGFKEFEKLAGKTYKVTLWHRDTDYIQGPPEVVLSLVDGEAFGPHTIEHHEKARATTVQFTSQDVHVHGVEIELVHL